MATRYGTYLRMGPLAHPTIIHCDDQRLYRDLNRPWGRKYLTDLCGVPAISDASAHVGNVVLDAPSPDRNSHSIGLGISGYGKTRSTHLLNEHHLRSGGSGMFFELKHEEIRAHAATAIRAGLRPEQIIYIGPRDTSIPGFNPYNLDLPVLETSGDLAAIVERLGPPGVRIRDIFASGSIAIGSHNNLSLLELSRFLGDSDYRARLLAQPITPGDPIAYEEASLLFTQDMARAKPAEQAQLTAPVLTRLRECLRNGFLTAFLCPRRNNLNLARLWQRQHVVLVHLDPPTLGDMGVRLLAGILASTLLRTALRAEGPVQVLLSIDELGFLEAFVGDALKDILIVARSRGLSLQLTTQHLALLSDEVRSAALANCARQTFFRLGHADAKLVAASLAASTPLRLMRCSAKPERVDAKTGRTALAFVRHPILDPQGRSLKLSADAWKGVQWEDTFGGAAVHRLAAIARSIGIERLFVRAADTGEPVALHRYLAGLQSHEYAFTNTPHLAVSVFFPRPKVTTAEKLTEAEAARRWLEVLTTLPVQHAVWRVPGRPPGVIKVADSTPPKVDERVDAFLAAAIMANSQSADEIQEARAWRLGRMKTLVGGRTDPHEEINDGSLD